MRHINKIVFLVVVAIALVAGTVMAMTASAPVSDGGVTPYIINGANPGGNRTCAEVGFAFYGDANYYEFSSDRVNYPDVPDGFGISTDGTYVSWGPFAHNGLAMIVKGSSDANVYVYGAGMTSDSGLASPPNASGRPAGLSNLTVCWNPPVVEEEEQWCSPGYWRQPHHLHAWEATGYETSDLFFDALGYYPTLSQQGRRNNATTNPTLLQVLQAPQYYGGGDFNAVGDLLSAAHPDVNFNGTRVENSCPLN